MPEHLIHIPETDSATGQPKQNKNQRKCAWERERKRRKGVNQKRRDQEGDGEVGGEENRTEQMKVTGLDERSGLVD